MRIIDFEEKSAKQRIRRVEFVNSGKNRVIVVCIVVVVLQIIHQNEHDVHNAGVCSPVFDTQIKTFHHFPIQIWNEYEFLCFDFAYLYRIYYFDVSYKLAKSLKIISMIVSDTMVL